MRTCTTAARNLTLAHKSALLCLSATFLTWLPAKIMPFATKSRALTKRSVPVVQNSTKPPKKKKFQKGSQTRSSKWGGVFSARQLE